ncbi:hypothetical protein EXIGLDRAFT_834761 [Exidia glandulosa HHB12029]|uniref:Uncharacterized protein n=1 Tax=Exidia glandulosa HHB12029 TaxID=1314781 RepID=A0A165JG62_EXIGL|nr:hypothetical protein EXIGLDRAFT_834761 [Exidia glandulosa HHB12029]
MLSTPPRPALRRAFTASELALSSPQTPGLFEHSRARAGFKSGWIDTYDPLDTGTGAPNMNMSMEGLDYFSLPVRVEVEVEGEERARMARSTDTGPISVKASEPLHQLLMRSGKFSQQSHSLPSSPAGGPARRRAHAPTHLHHARTNSPPSAWHSELALSPCLTSLPVARRMFPTPSSAVKVKVYAQSTGDICAFRFSSSSLAELLTRARLGPKETLYVATSPPGHWETWDSTAPVTDDAALEMHLRAAVANGTLRLVAAA